MYKSRIVILLLSVVSIISLRGQSVIAEFPLPDDDVKNIQSFATDQNIYLLFVQVDSVYNTYQIKADGTSKPLSFNHVENALLVGVKDKGDNTLFYYLEGKKQDMRLTAMVYNHSTGKSNRFEQEIKIEGQVVGVSNDDIFSLVYYQKSSNVLKVMQLKWFDIVNEKSFDLPVHLTTDYKYISYIGDYTLPSIDDGSAKYKLYKKDNQLFFSIDYTFLESNSSDPQTTLMTFDLESGEQTIKSFPVKTKDIFRSFFSQDLLYRSTISKNKFQLEIVNVATSETIQKKELKRDTTMKKSFVYIRNGKTHRISKQESLHDMMKKSGACEPSVITLPSTDSCNTTLVWSTFYADENLMIVPAFAINPLIGILTMAGSGFVGALKKPTTISRYFYIGTNCQHEFNSDESTIKSKSEMIDEYEISLDQKRIFYKDKAYFRFHKNIIGLYFNARQPKITLIKF